MSQATDFLRRIRACLGGFERAAPGSAMPQRADLGKGRHRFFCGSPRHRGPEADGFTFEATGYTLAFEVFAEESEEGMQCRSFSVHLLNVGRASIFFHKDPEKALWPDHPERHIQFDATPNILQEIPFLGWRLPLGELGPLACLEYVAARGVHPE